MFPHLDRPLCRIIPWLTQQGGPPACPRQEAA